MINQQLLTIILSIVIPLGGLVLVQARALRQDMTQVEARLREDMHQDTAQLHKNMKELRGEVSDLRDRMGRIEGTLDILRQFLLDSGRGTAASMSIQPESPVRQSTTPDKCHK